jgi:hypothetical protein
MMNTLPSSIAPPIFIDSAPASASAESAGLPARSS